MRGEIRQAPRTRRTTSGGRSQHLAPPTSAIFDDAPRRSRLALSTHDSRVQELSSPGLDAPAGGGHIGPHSRRRAHEGGRPRVERRGGVQERERLLRTAGPLRAAGALRAPHPVLAAAPTLSGGIQGATARSPRQALNGAVALCRRAAAPRSFRSTGLQCPCRAHACATASGREGARGHLPKGADSTTRRTRRCSHSFAGR